MDTLNVAIVGMGLMGKLYARLLKHVPGAAVAAVCDLEEEPLVRFAAEAGISPGIFAGGDVDGMLKAHPEVEAVFICTPEAAHAGPARLAAAAGKHLFIEKPLATTAEDGRSIAGAVAAAGVRCMVGFSLRFDPRYAAAREAIARGDIGQVVHMYARRNSPLFILKRIGGREGGTHWVGSHDLDLMLWIKGCGVRSVFSRQAGQASAQFPVEQAISSSLRFEDGSIAVLENVWGTVNTPGRHDRIEFQANGTLGSVEVHPVETGTGVFREGTAAYPDTVYMPVVQGKITGVYRDEVEYFLDLVRGAREPYCTVEDGLRALAVAEAIERSRREEREVFLG
jgi:predicted dehydrogenase